MERDLEGCVNEMVVFQYESQKEKMRESLVRVTELASQLWKPSGE
ncbi:hypothetical protein COLO4_29957 [Corchorus olitorius]|uniref:Uncharacterized protein n=1 Tax=Corchorus olitorius TaxID=93759 RepID=A0A1R3HCL5_9ROSI|nr:hypothetical protein COLO4_29957 [Corchorus olitorius]